MKRIGVLTSGGDTPGMNAAIRAIVKTGQDKGLWIMGILHGFSGLINGEIVEIGAKDVEDIAAKGGTILKTARSELFKKPEGQQKALNVIRAFKLDGIIAIGGDGTFRGVKALCDHNVPTIGLPGTIDNDLPYTDFTIGFDTAVNSVVAEIAKIRDTMASHDRVGVVEVMGNRCGDIALWAGLAGGAEAIVVPEMPYDRDAICEILTQKRIKGCLTSIVVINEKSGSAGELAQYISENTDLEARAIVLGYTQRGGAPSAFDRMLASRLGARAVELLTKGRENCVVGIRDNQVVDYDVDVALAMQPRFDKELYRLAHILSF